MMRRLIPAIAAALIAALSMSPVAAQVTGTTPSVYAGGTAPAQLPATPIAPPALPLANGAKLMAFGDSHAGFNGFASATAVTAYEKGLVEAAWEADPRFTFDSLYLAGTPWGAVSSVGYVNGGNQGVPGDHLVSGNAFPGINARLAYTLSRAPAILWVSAGTNSIATGDDSKGPSKADYIIAGLDTIITQATARGVWVILPTYYPRNDAFFGQAQSLVAQQVNEWIRAQAGRAGVKVYDPYAALLAPGSTYLPNPLYFMEGSATGSSQNGTHLNSAGVELVSQNYLIPLLQSMVASGSTFDQTPANSNLWPSGTYGLTGTTGTKVGGQSTGSVATGYSLRMTRASGTVAQVASKDATNATYNRQIITINNGDAAAAWQQSTLTFPALALTPVQAAAGSWVQAWVRIETPLGAPVPVVSLIATLSNASAVVKGTLTGGAIDTQTYVNASTPQRALGRGVYWLRTPPFQLPADGDYASLATTVTMNWWGAAYPAGQSMPVTIDRPILRVVTDPRGAWGLP